MMRIYKITKHKIGVFDIDCDIFVKATSIKDALNKGVIQFNKIINYWNKHGDSYKLITENAIESVSLQLDYYEVKL